MTKVEDNIHIKVIKLQPFEQTPVSLWTLYIFKSDFNGTVFQKVPGSSWDRAVGLENSL